jgi:hypothetical protein
MASYLFSSESVTEGHPDKLCDAVSDAILDACLAVDPHSRVACETVAKTGFVLVAGEITTHAQLDFQKIVRKTVHDIGFTSSDIGFDAAMRPTPRPPDRAARSSRTRATSSVFRRRVIEPATHPIQSDGDDRPSASTPPSRIRLS